MEVAIAGVRSHIFFSGSSRLPCIARQDNNRIGCVQQPTIHASFPDQAQGSAVAKRGTPDVAENLVVGRIANPSITEEKQIAIARVQITSGVIQPQSDLWF
jgi:hypothetical protein